MTTGLAGAKRFSDSVILWEVAAPSDTIVSRTIAAADGLVVGVMPLADAMVAGGIGAGWLAYFGVDDINSPAERARSVGGPMLVEPRRIEGVGRFSLLADPLGGVLRDAGFAGGATRPSKKGPDRSCGWNE